MDTKKAVPVTDTRRETFLRVLEETGLVTAAAAAASPHCTGKEPGKKSFYDLRARDPQFAAAWDAAANRALARVEQELLRRAMEPARTPICNPKTGEVVGYREDRLASDKVLLRVASYLSKGAWAENRKIDVSGTVEHEHSQHLQLTVEDLQYLETDEQQNLIQLLDKIRERKDPKAIAADAEVISDGSG